MMFRSCSTIASRARPWRPPLACDHATAMHDLVSHLAKGGIARAVFVAGPRLAPVSEDRLRGAQAALAELGLPPAFGRL